MSDYFKSDPKVAQVSPQPVKKALWAIVIGLLVLAALVLVAGIKIGSSNEKPAGNSQAGSSGARQTGTSAAGQPPAAIQWQPVYGHFVVRAGKVRTYTLNEGGKRPGENLFVVPARCITYGKLVNGKEAGIFPADPAATTKPAKVEVNPLARTVGYYAPESTEDEIFLFVSTPEIRPPADFIWRAAQTVPR